MADNFQFDITGAPLKQCLDIAILGAPGKKVVGWRVDEKPNRLVLYWSNNEGATPLPAPLSGEALLGFVQAWLESVEYGSEPDHDGSNSRGWRVYNEQWGQVAGNFYAFAAIEPVWLMHGK